MKEGYKPKFCPFQNADFTPYLAGNGAAIGIAFIYPSQSSSEQINWIYKRHRVEGFARKIGVGGTEQMDETYT